MIEAVPVGTFAVVLSARADQMEPLSARLTAAGVAHARIVETDGEWTGQLVAIGARPGLRSALRRNFSSFPLYGRVTQSRAPGSGLNPSSGTNLRL